jgi:hypothetical protein
VELGEDEIGLDRAAGVGVRNDDDPDIFDDV